MSALVGWWRCLASGGGLTVTRVGVSGVGVWQVAFVSVEGGMA